MRVVDEEQVRLRIVEITLSDVLPVTSIINKSDGTIVEHAGNPPDRRDAGCGG
jgi:hypothetical protein